MVNNSVKWGGRWGRKHAACFDF